MRLQDEGRKTYQNLTKKLKKELGDRYTPSFLHIRQLLPLPRIVTEVVTVDTGCLTDNKGNKISFDSVDKKHGLSVSIATAGRASLYTSSVIY